MLRRNTSRLATLSSQAGRTLAGAARRWTVEWGRSSPRPRGGWRGGPMSKILPDSGRLCDRAPTYHP